MKVGLTIFFFVLSGYYLYPSFQGYFMNRTADSLSEEERVEWERENAAKIRTVNEKALKLGLDLQGGMHVTLEVRVEALIDALATDKDEVFESVLEEARAEAFQSGESVIDAFVSIFEDRDPNARLSRYFRNEAAGISRRSTNAEVAAWLSTEADAAVTRAIEIIRDRVDRYGVTEPAIQRQGSRRVIVELPGIDDEERIRGLLRGTARLDFRLMAEPEELLRSLQRIIEYYEVEPDSTEGAVADTSMDVLDLLDTGEDGSSSNKLLDKFQPIGQGVILGSSVAADTAAVNAMLDAPEVKAMLPAGVTLMYTSSPEGVTADGEEVYYIVGVLNEADLTGDVVTDARVEFDPFTNVPEVSMDMNSEGARTWARMTGANVGKQVAIVLDGVVYSFPTIQQRITGGRTNITNLASREEASDIVTVLKSGALPAPVDIVEERTVGPSLGERSIKAGLNSVILGLVLVALFMIFYYRGGGMIANLALILNLIFVIGILAGFNATLTLPGIAGIVLTIGMAVDANVLIFERIREEQSTGKTLKASVDGGYSKALSAIFDANITTFFVGVILYSFGLGPIQGFAVTLMAGILSSLFTAIVFTRIIFDYLISERRMTVSVG